MGERNTWGDGVIKNSQAKTYLDGYKVTGTGTAVITIGSKQAVLTDNGVGDYTLTFNEPYAREIIPVVTALTAGLVAEISTVSKSAVRILLKNPQLKANAYQAAYNQSFAQFIGQIAADAANAAAFNTAYAAGSAAAIAAAATAGATAAAAVTGLTDGVFELHVLGFQYAQEY